MSYLSCTFHPVYDITKRSSFLNLQRWIEEVRRYTASNVILILIGNKSDSEDLREVEFAEAEALCQYIPEIRMCMETSAKDNRNITEAFMSLATELKVGNWFSFNWQIPIWLIIPFQRRQDNLSADEDSDGAIKLGQGEALDNCSTSNCNLLWWVNGVYNLTVSQVCKMIKIPRNRVG